MRPAHWPDLIHGLHECKVLELLLSAPNTPNEYSVISCIGWIHYLAAKDDNLLGNSGSLAFQELLNDVDTEGTSPDDGEM